MKIHIGGNDFNSPSSLLASSQQSPVSIFTGKIEREV